MHAASRSSPIRPATHFVPSHRRRVEWLKKIGDDAARLTLHCEMHALAHFLTDEIERD